MADKPRLKNPRVQVILVDGTEYEVQTLNMDMLKWERTATKHKWASFQSTPVMWMTFIAWSASIRESLIPASTTWEKFSDELCASVSDPDDGNSDVSVDPTGPVVGTG